MHQRAGLDAEGFGWIARGDGAGGLHHRRHDDDRLAPQGRIFPPLARGEKTVQIKNEPAQQTGPPGPLHYGVTKSCDRFLCERRGQVKRPPNLVIAIWAAWGAQLAVRALGQVLRRHQTSTPGPQICPSRLKRSFWLAGGWSEISSLLRTLKGLRAVHGGSISIALGGTDPSAPGEVARPDTPAHKIQSSTRKVPTLPRALKWARALEAGRQVRRAAPLRERSRD